MKDLDRPWFPHTTTGERKGGVSGVFTDPELPGVSLRLAVGAQVLGSLVGALGLRELQELLSAAGELAQAADVLAVALIARQASEPGDVAEVQAPAPEPPAEPPPPAAAEPMPAAKRKGGGK